MFIDSVYDYVNIYIQLINSSAMTVYNTMLCVATSIYKYLSRRVRYEIGKVMEERV